MRYLLTEHGSVLKYDEASGSLMILNMENEWDVLKGYDVTLPVRTRVVKKRNNIIEQPIVPPPAAANVPPPPASPSLVQKGNALASPAVSKSTPLAPPAPKFQAAPPPPPPPGDEKPSASTLQVVPPPPPPPPVEAVQITRTIQLKTKSIKVLNEDAPPPPPIPSVDESLLRRVTMSAVPLPPPGSIPANLPPPPPPAPKFQVAPPPPPPPGDEKPSASTLQVVPPPPPPPPIEAVQITRTIQLKTKVKEASEEDNGPAPTPPPFDDSLLQHDTTAVVPLPPASRIPAHLPLPSPLQHEEDHPEEIQYEYTAGSIKIDDNTIVIISDIDQIPSLDDWKGKDDLDNSDKLATLGAAQERRVRAGMALRKEVTATAQKTMSDEERWKMSAERAGKPTYHYQKFMTFVEAEKKRLKKPFTINGKAKIRKIEAAQEKMEKSLSLWSNSEEGQSVREKKGYIQQARESGMIDALNWHRIRWSRAKKREKPTASILRLEEEAPGISRKI